MLDITYDDINLAKRMAARLQKRDCHYLFTYNRDYIVLEYATNKQYGRIVVDVNGKNFLLKPNRYAYQGGKDEQDKIISQLKKAPEYRLVVTNPKEMIDFIFRTLLCTNGFKVRENQITLSKDIYDNICTGKTGLYEANVGIGKTHAYLIACIVHQISKKQGDFQTSPYIITTSSIELQNAILRNYLPYLSSLLLEQKIINQPLCAVVRKGKEHYLCEMRYYNFISYLAQSLKERDINLYQIFLELNLPSNSIDLDSYKVLKNHVVQKINVPKDCNRRCPHYKKCRYKEYSAYIRLSQHDFQICNHNYYLADAIKRKRNLQKLIPEHSVVIIDEAHKIFDAAMQMCCVDLNNNSVKELEWALRRHSGKSYKEIGTMIKPLIDLNQIIFDYLKQLLPLNYQNGEPYAIEINQPINILLNKFIRTVVALKETILYPTQEILWFFDNLEWKICSLTKKDQVFWLEKKGKYLCLCGISCSLDEELYKLIWSDSIPKVITSGTLKDDTGFKFFKRKVGLSNMMHSRIAEYSYSSPFNYPANSALYISEKIPFPNRENPTYISKLENEILELLQITNGHAVILFTSYTLLIKIYDLIKDEIVYPVYKMDRSAKGSIQNFKNSRNGVLFAAGSFWEGVDCPGDILSLLIIVNLPFPVQSHLLDHRRKKYDSLEKFIQSEIVSEMLTTLRQGMGRLIRKENDTGVIAILDSRASTKGKYHRRILASCSQYPVVSNHGELKKRFKTWKDSEYYK